MKLRIFVKGTSVVTIDKETAAAAIRQAVFRKTDNKRRNGETSK